MAMGDPMTLKGITMAKTKGPSPIDIHVGSRMRMRRMALGMSREKLAKALRLTFQQVQKYEKGANRMASSRLQQAADVLGVAAAFFFEGAGGGPYGSAPAPAYIDDFVASEEGLRLAKSFYAPTPSGPSSYRRSRERGRGSKSPSRGAGGSGYPWDI